MNVRRPSIKALAALLWAALLLAVLAVGCLAGDQDQAIQAQADDPRVEWTTLVIGSDPALGDITMIILTSGQPVTLTGNAQAHLMAVGGLAPGDSETIQVGERDLSFTLSNNNTAP